MEGSPTSAHIVAWHANELNNTLPESRLDEICKVVTHHVNNDRENYAKEFIKDILKYNFMMGVFSEIVDPVDGED